jgi:hypothetical protein
MSKLDRPMPSVSLAGDTDGTEKPFLEIIVKTLYVEALVI